MKLLMKYNPEFGLKDAKMSLDQMLAGYSILYKFKSNQMKEFIGELDDLQVVYELKLTVGNQKETGNQCKKQK